MAVRHGITAWNLERRYQGQRDIPLLFPDAEEGLLTLRKALMDERFDAIYASDLGRCQQTLAWSQAAKPGIPVYAELRRIMDGTTFAPVVFAHMARVALGDEIGELLGARSLVMLIGERPGLSSADSLGAYITRDPRKGRVDSERNCISNIRPDGLSHERAARNIAWILKEAERIGETGIALKDRRDRRSLDHGA